MRTAALATEATQRVAKRSRAAFEKELLILSREAFSVLAHELGNAATPVGMIASALALNSEPVKVRAATSTLRAVSERLRALTSLTRQLGGMEASSFMPHDSDTSLQQWWSTFAPVVEILLPATQRLDCDLSGRRIPTATLSALTLGIPAIAHFLVLTAPQSTRLSIASEAAPPDVTCITFTVMASHTVASAASKRWLAFARHVVRARNGTLQLSFSDSTLRVALRIS
jgi:hypothetical protein